MKELPELVKCAERELAMRKRVYPKWVESGKMRPEIADHETECMAEIARVLQQLERISGQQTELEL